MRAPWVMSCATTRFTVSTGTPKPTPAEAPLGETMAVDTAMRRPRESSSGPPESAFFFIFYFFCGESEQSASCQRSDAARTARVDGGVGLHHASDAAAGDASHVAADARHHARRQRLVQAEGVADGEHALANLNNK